MLLLVVRQIILIFFIFIWQYSFSTNIPNCTETVTKPWYKLNRKKVEPCHPYTVHIGAVVADWIERRTCNPRFWVRISAPAGIVHDWGDNLEQCTEPPNAPRATQRQLPTAPSVCALGWVKCREHISLLVILFIITYVTNTKFFFF